MVKWDKIQSTTETTCLNRWSYSKIEIGGGPCANGLCVKHVRKQCSLFTFICPPKNSSKTIFLHRNGHGSNVPSYQKNCQLLPQRVWIFYCIKILHKWPSCSWIFHKNLWTVYWKFSSRFSSTKFLRGNIHITWESSQIHLYRWHFYFH